MEIELTRLKYRKHAMIPYINKYKRYTEISSKTMTIPILVQCISSCGAQTVVMEISIIPKIPFIILGP
jgi:hypothetical protein